MARVVLIAVCGVLVFVLVSKFAPHFLETYLPAGGSSESTPGSPDTTDNSKSPSAKKKVTTPKPKSGTAQRSWATASTAPTQSEFANSQPPIAVTAPLDQATQLPADASRRITRVTAENATLYLTNTGGGPVVGRLAKGSVVEPVFVVSTAGQTWTFVSTSDQETAGFLRSDALAKPGQADQPSQ